MRITLISIIVGVITGSLIAGYVFFEWGKSKPALVSETPKIDKCAPPAGKFIVPPTDPLYGEQQENNCSFSVSIGMNAGGKKYGIHNILIGDNASLPDGVNENFVNIDNRVCFNRVSLQILDCKTGKKK